MLFFKKLSSLEEIFWHLFRSTCAFRKFLFFTHQSHRELLLLLLQSRNTILHHHTIYTFSVCIFNRIADDKKQKEEEKKSEKFQSSVFVILKMIFNFFLVCLYLMISERVMWAPQWVNFKEERVSLISVTLELIYLTRDKLYGMMAMCFSYFLFMLIGNTSKTHSESFSD